MRAVHRISPFLRSAALFAAAALAVTSCGKDDTTAAVPTTPDVIAVRLYVGCTNSCQSAPTPPVLPNQFTFTGASTETRVVHAATGVGLVVTTAWLNRDSIADPVATYLKYKVKVTSTSAAMTWVANPVNNFQGTMTITGAQAGIPVTFSLEPVAGGTSIFGPVTVTVISP